MAKETTTVATELDEKLLRALDEKREPEERSRAAEVRLAIRAWTGKDREPETAEAA